MNYTLYFIDTETTGLSSDCEIIELSLIRSTDYAQKTWCLKPTNTASIELGALRVNGHKLEDITWQTKTGKDTYKNPVDVIVEIENWIAEDMAPAEGRILVAHNVVFDKNKLEQLWARCGSSDTFPFGRRTLDTGSIDFFMDWCKGEMAEGYSLRNLAKKYGVKNDKAHTAASDTLTLKDIFEKQVEAFKKILVKQGD